MAMIEARVGDRLRDIRLRRFVGRAAELELLRSALDAGPPPFSVLYVHGPGGIGKTALLVRFAEHAVATGRTVIHLDARTLEVSPPGLRAAVGDVRPGALLLFDTYEMLAGLDDWLRESYLPSLPADVIVVIAEIGRAARRERGQTPVCIHSR